MPSATHRRMIDMQAQLPPLAGFSSISFLRGLMESKGNTSTCKSVPSVGAKSTCEGDSSGRTDKKLRLLEADSVDDNFFPSDHSEMPSTREPSPEPFWDAAKRYGCRAEDIFPRPIMFPPRQPPEIPPSAYPTRAAELLSRSADLPSRSAELLSSSAERPGPAARPAASTAAGSAGLSLDYLASQHAIGRQTEGRSEAGGELCNSTVSQQAFNLMQQESMKLNRDTTWLRVVHRGYGQVAWRTELWGTNLTFVHGHFAAEGDYFLISEGLSVQALVDVLTEVNKKMRKIVRFSAMKQGNKSRVLFKWEPFTVSPIVHELPVLVKFSK